MGANKWAQLLLFCVMPSLKAVCLLSIMYSVFKYACVVAKLIHVFPLLTSVYVYVCAVVCLAVGMAMWWLEVMFTQAIFSWSG